MAKSCKRSGGNQPVAESTGFSDFSGQPVPTKFTNCSDTERPLPEFTERDIRLILKSLPVNTDADKLRWVADYLPVWAKHRLPVYLVISEQRLVGKPRRQVLDTLKLALNLWDAIREFDPVTRRATIRRLPPPPSINDPEGTRPFWWATDKRFAEGQLLFDQFRDHLQMFIHGLMSVQTKEGPGQPRNLVPMMIVEELAQIFEDATGLKARRETNRSPGDYEPYETGPFYEFVAAVWPVIFGSDERLSSALRKWAIAYSKTEWP